MADAGPSLPSARGGDGATKPTTIGQQDGDEYEFPLKPIKRVRSYSGSLGDVGAALGLDIGGSLAKLVIFEPEQTSNQGLKNLTSFIRKNDKYGETGQRCNDLSFKSTALGGYFHFIQFETSHMSGAIEIIKQNGFDQTMKQICATGGGAVKFSKIFQDVLGIKLTPLDELGTIVKALQFLVSQNPEEIYSLEGVDLQHTGEQVQKVPIDLGNGTLYPYMLCNIGSGVSIMQVNSETDAKRVSGTALGGATFFGLAQLLTELDSFSDCMDSAAVGDERHVNMLVKDIYGTGIPKFNLPGDFTASFFGKVKGGTYNAKEQKREDICKALVVMITQNISQIAFLNAVIHGSPRVIFTGSFLRHNPIALRTLAYAMKRWNGKDQPKRVQAHFLWHEGHLGAMGSYLENLDLDFFLRNQMQRKSPSLDEKHRQERLAQFYPRALASNTALKNPPAPQGNGGGQLKRE
jgi:type II pantothenate kinase|eukprot:g8450.t1